MSDEVQTVDITEPEVSKAPENKPATREELKASGWSEAELESAEKRGMIQKPPKKKEEPETDETTTAEPKVPEVKEAPKEEPKKEAPKRSTLPDFTFQTPEQEKVFLDAFGAGTPQRAMYFRMKNERQSRQAAESRVRELEARIQALETPLPEKRMELDENGNEIDPEDKPLTLKQLRELQKKEAEERTKADQELNSRARVVTDAQRTQEEFARSVLPDFDGTINLAKDVMANLDTIVPEKWRQEKVVRLIQQLQVAAANADKLGADDYNAAFIAHEIGQFHPDYGKAADGENAEMHSDGNPDRSDKVNGGRKHTPDEMKRIEANTQRRASSASIPGGGGKRTVSVDDVGLPELNRMPFVERQRFKEKYPDKYAKLLRG